MTEGAVGLRIEHEFGFTPDPRIMYAPLIYQRDSRKKLAVIYRQYLDAAKEYALSILLMTNTRRANYERMASSAFAGRNVMKHYALFLRELAADYPGTAFIGGMMGCKGDAYTGADTLSFEEAVRFHSWQAEMFRDAPIDYYFAALMPALEETRGQAALMAGTGKPYIISFMLCKNGNLPDGHSLDEAIRAIDAGVRPAPLCCMTNCVHPAVLRQALSAPANDTDLVKERFSGIQANAACLDTAILDGSREVQTSY